MKKTSLVPAALLLLLACTAPLPAVEETKPYTLFMGTDFAVPQDKEYYRVRDVVGGAFLIKVKDQEVQVPMRKGTGSLKIEQGLKLTGTTALIDKLKTERAYTSANDPHLKFASRASAVLGADAAMSISYSNMSSAIGRSGLAGAQLDRAIGTPDEGLARAEASAASAAADSASESYGNAAYDVVKSDFNNPGTAALELQIALAEENYDAMRYSFELSSEKPLSRPYLVFIVSYHPKDAKPGSGPGTIIYARATEPIGPQPRKINILQTGMPIGFIVDECQVRLYDAGQEVATNVAPRRVAMTKEEAFLYMKIDRISRAKGVTLPATPALGRLDEETKSRLTLDQLKQTYYVKVTKDGHAEKSFLDQACTQPAAEGIAAVISSVRFYPALENGKAQEGVAKLLFSQIPI